MYAPSHTVPTGWGRRRYLLYRIVKMSRWKLTIEYYGKPYAGWQVQPDMPTVQGEIMIALKKLFKQDIPLQGAGRTDSGVHAKGQVAHFDCDTNLTTLKIREALNHFLFEKYISILQVESVADDFDARFSAKQRQYLYRISNRRSPLTFEKDTVWYTGGYILDAQKMHDAGQLLVGTHDFTTFRSASSDHQKPIRTLDYLTVESVGEEIHLRCGAKSFLHNQVRYITGALFFVGYGKWTKQHIQMCLDVKDRNKGGTLAPAHGLYFSQVIF